MNNFCKTLPAELCGERALNLLPRPNEYDPGEVLIVGGPLKAIDAWGGATLRCLIEYLGRYRQGRVTLSPCDDPETWERLHALVRKNHPAHLVLPDDTEEHNGDVPSEILLQAESVPTVERAAALAQELFEACEADMPESARFAAKCLPELVSNALQHAKQAPVPPVVCAYHDRAHEALQLVVVDLGQRTRQYDQKSLSEVVLASNVGGLGTLVGHAKERRFDVSLTVASGTGRLHWQNGSLRKATAESIPGFCSAITIPV